MADGPSLGTAYLRVAGDFSGLNAQGAALFRSSQWGAMGKAAGAALGAGLLAGGALTALYKIGEAVDDAEDNIRVKTGASGKHLEKLSKSFQSVANRVPVDFGMASDAVAGLNQRLELTGKPLTRLSKQIAQLSKITGTDVQTNVQSISRLFEDWSIKTGSQTDTLDKLYRLTQDTGVGLSDLSQQMVQFGSPLRQLGMDFDTSAAMFAAFEQQGVNVQTLMPGLRMALKNLSMPTDDLAKKLKELGVAGEDPDKSLQAIMETIKDAPSTLKANALAFEVFGARAGPDMAAAIREGRFELDDLIKHMNSGKDTIGKAERSTRDFSEEWTLFKNNLETQVEPAARKVFDAIGDEMGQITDIISDKNLSWEEKWDALTDEAMDALEDLVSRAGTLAPKVAEAFVHGFLNAPILGQLALSGWLVKKFGGFGALGKVLGTGGLGGPISSKTPIPVYVVNNLPGGGGGPDVIGGSGGRMGLVEKLARLSFVVGGTALAFEGVMAALPKADTAEQRRQADFMRAHNPDTSGMFRGLTDGKINESLDKTLKKIGDIADALSDPRMQGTGFAKAIERDGILARDRIGAIIDKLGDMPPAARKEAADTMIGMAAQFESKGKLPEGSADRLRDTVVSSFGGMHVKSVDQLEEMVKESGSKLGQMAKQGTARMQDFREGASANVYGLASAVRNGLQNIGDNTAKALGALDVKFTAYQLAEVIGKGADKKMARGGLLPGYSKTDNVHIMARSGEAILTPEVHQPIVNNALQATYGMGLNDLFRKTGAATSGGRFATGGVIEQALGPYTIPPITYDPNHAGGNSHVHLDFFTQQQAIAYGKKMQTMGWGIGEYSGPYGGFGPITTQHQSPGHYDGTAFDANTAADETKAQVAAVARLLNGKGGTPLVGAVIEKLKKVMLEGPDGPLKNLGQASLDKVWSAANKFIESKTPTGQTTGRDNPVGYVSGGGGPVPGQIGRILLQNSLDRESAAGIIGNAYGESNWVPSSIGSGGGGLWGFTASPVSLADLQAYASAQGKPWTDVGLQTQFMLNHLPADLRGQMNALSSTDATTSLFMHDWERPLNYLSLPTRQAAAQRAFAMSSWAKGGVIPEFAAGGVVGRPIVPMGGGGGHLRGLLGQLGAHKPKKRHKALGAILDKVRSLGLNEETFKRLTKLTNAATDDQDFADFASQLNGDMPWELGYDSTPGNQFPWQLLGGDGEVIQAFVNESYARESLAALVDSATGRFKGHTELEWLAGNGGPGALQDLFNLRNVLVRAEEQVEGRQNVIQQMIDAAQKAFRRVVEDVKELEKKIRTAQHDLDVNQDNQAKTQKALDKAKEDLDTEKAKDKKHRSPARIDALEKKIRQNAAHMGVLRDEREGLRGRLADLLGKKTQAEAERDTLKTKVIPEMTSKASDLSELSGQILGDGSDSFSGLIGVQGTQGPKRVLASLPALGELGGDIFTVQKAIADLGVLPTATDTTPSSDSETPADTTGPQGFNISELLDFVQAIRYGVFDSNLLGIPAHHGGGIVQPDMPGGTREVLRRMMPGEGVVDAATMSRGISAGDGTYEMTITNWDEGRVLIRRVSDDQITERNRGTAAVVGAGAVAR